MKAQLVKIGLKAAPYVKKGLPVLASMTVGAIEGLAKHKKAVRIDNMEQRIVELEKLLIKKEG